MTADILSRKFVPNMLPAALVDRLGVDVVERLCKIRFKSHMCRNRRCPKCHSRQGQLRVQDRTVKCRNCGNVFKVPGRFE